MTANKAQEPEPRRPLQPVPDAAAAPLEPANVAAEEQLLGALLLAAASGPDVAHTTIDDVQTRVDPQEFYSAKRGQVYRAILAVHEAGGLPDILGVSDELRGRGELDEVGSTAFLTQLSTISTAYSNAAHFADLVRDAAARRRQYRFAESLRGAALAGGLHSEPALLEEMHALLFPSGQGAALVVETWRQFETAAHDHVPCIVDGLLPEGSLGFLASPPKAGKTWVGLSLGLSVAAARAFLGYFAVPEPRTVAYVALEGHRAALRARIGCLARGLGVDPDGNDLDRFHLIYKPAGLNLADPGWAGRVRTTVNTIGADLVIVDVLRAAARINENSAEDFAGLRANLAPCLADGRSLVFLHHFTKVNETTKERVPAERMSGSGAMFGALDAGIFITGSENDGRRLRVEFSARDIATPGPMGFQLEGKPTGPNGGFGYRDRAWWTPTSVPGEEDVDVPAEQILAWLVENEQQVTRSQIADAFELSDKTVARREPRLEQLGVTITRKPGKPTTFDPPRPPQPAPLTLDTTPDTTQDRHPGHDPLSHPKPHEQAVPEVGQDTLDTECVLPKESADLQGKKRSDTLDTPYGGVSPARAATTPEPEPSIANILEQLAKTDHP